MPTQSDTTPFIIDNSDSAQSVVDYLRGQASTARALDIASGYFEIGALLALDGVWQPLDQLRLLMGDEVSHRTRAAFEEALRALTSRLDDSLEAAKSDDDFLSGVPAIVDALRTRQIEARVYRAAKFHAKMYLTHPTNLNGAERSALVGSSNFTLPGLHQNVELNVHLNQNVAQLQAWYDRHWDAADDVTPDVLRVIERHVREYAPFEVYIRALAAYFRSHELSVSEWETGSSKIYPILAHYQREGYHALMQIARRYNGALLCDGVGLGKTFVGLMVIERLLFERKRVALIVPKAARADVWEVKLRQYLPDVRGHFSNLVIYNHTDLTRGGDYLEAMQEIADKVDAIIIDEAHHFRNISSERARRLYSITENKQLFLLTATPVNNSLYDLMHLIEYFSRRKPDYFRAPPLAIHTLRGHFRQMEDALAGHMQALNGADGSEINEVDNVMAERVLSSDTLFQSLVVQRSRAYVKRSLQHEGQALFPTREDPRVADYSLQKTYGRLLGKIEAAFDKERPLLNLSIYNPLAFYRRDKSDLDPFDTGRQSQVVALIRTLLLKRFESSIKAFEASCEDMALRLLWFIQLHNPQTATRWENQHRALMNRITAHHEQRDMVHQDDTFDEDVVTEEQKGSAVRLDEREYDVTRIVLDTILDLDQLSDFLSELADFEPTHDDKMQRLIALLQTDSTLRDHKVLIFTEFKDTARYIAEQLRRAEIGPLMQIDSQSKDSVSTAIRAFSPYYNGGSSVELAADNVPEIRVLIATDILAEGLNLQDATCVINYDLHWNPVRLMQRIGRVDRRLDPLVEARLINDNPAEAAIRGTVKVWNFLPPADLNRVLSLYERVTHKTLRISKTFGIEGRKLLTPDDDYEALRDFNQTYEGITTPAEEMYLIYQELLAAYPDLFAQADGLPLRLFSGKAAYPDELSAEARGVFFCYRLPAPDVTTAEWTTESGFTRWLLYNCVTGELEDDAARIHPIIACTPETPRRVVSALPALSDIRKRIDVHLHDVYLKKMQAPAGVKPILLAWLELS